MAAVLGAVGSLAPKLLQLLQSEYELQKNVRRKLKFVSDELESIRPALNKVAAVPWDQLDEQVKVWAHQVRDAAYDMEDVLDTFLLRVDGGEPVNHNRLKRAMKKMGGLFGKMKARHDIAGAIDDIEKQLQVIADRRARYKIDDIVANPAPATTVDPRLKAFYTEASQLVGIEEPREKLIKMLSIREDDGSSDKMKRISIVGFGGLGKTTLAKAVYHKVSHLFDCGGLVPVGCNPDPCKVLKDVLIELKNDAKKRKNIIGSGEKTSILDEERYTGSDLTGLDERQLIDQLHTFLQGKRYFVVVDDIWDIATWDVLKIALPDSNSRSRVIATTRKYDVSENIGEVYRMQKLPERHSIKLLYTRTFGTEEKWPGNNDEVAVVSQKILGKCDGVPLAIITIGSLLASKRTEEWSDVYDSVGFGLGNDTQVKNMKKILSFSYYDLPCHLRTCMLYLSMFPEDYVVYRGALLWMWIAEGLVKAEEGKDDIDIGESYFIELINRGMIQPVETSGVLIGCRVHDMVLHMIRDLSREEHFVGVQDSKKGSQACAVRRLALHKASPIPVINDMGMQKVRSFNAIYCGTSLTLPFSRFKLLRVLKLDGCRPLEGHLDTEYLGKLLHLRYLGILHTPIRELPKDIGNLRFLQALDLIGTGIEELPKSLGQLTKLRRLRADVKTRFPDWIGKLTSLVQLSMLGGDGNKWFVKELSKLRDLRMLCTRITLHDEEQVREFLLVLSNLQKMERIGIVTSKWFACTDGIMQPSFVTYCSNLRILQLEQLRFSRLPKWINPQAFPELCMLRLNLSLLYQQDMEILAKFQNLCCLSLNVSDFSSKISIDGCGRFQNLRFFEFDGLCQLEFVQVAVPRLEHIWLCIPVRRIFNTCDLGLKLGLGNIPALQVVQIVLDCDCCFPREVEEVEAELRHAVSIHPNRPTIQVNRSREDGMLSSSGSKIEEQKKRARRVESRISHLKQVHDAMHQEVVEMGKMETDFNLSYDTKNKVQRLLQRFGAIVGIVRDILLPVEDGTPINDRDLSRMTEDIAAMERAQNVLTFEYPPLAAMLDELRYVFSLDGGMPMPKNINLHIHVFDTKVAKLYPMDFQLLGKISSLQEIKAHLICEFCSPREVEEMEKELRHAVDIHHPNNPPTLDIIRYAQDKMVVTSGSDSHMLDQQKFWVTRLDSRIDHLKDVHNAMYHEVVEMGKMETDLNLIYDTKNKVQRFLQRFGAIVGIVRDILVPVGDGTPINDRDLSRMTEDIAAMERAQNVLTIEYPPLAAMLDGLRYVFSLQGVMPMPETINLYIHVFDIKVAKLGPMDVQLLGKISSLQKIKAHLICDFCFPTEVEEVEKELRHAVDIHHPNNPPTLDIIRYAQDKMVVNSDTHSHMLDRQKFRATRLESRITHLKQDHDALRQEVVVKAETKTDSNLSYDTKNKVQRFRQQFAATVHNVKRILLPVEDGTPINDRGLNRLMEDIAAMERAHDILTVEYPRFAAMLDELRYVFSLQGVMPMPETINLYIHVFDIKVAKLGPMDVQLLGKISSLQKIKAHLICDFCFPTEVEEVEKELRHAVDIHHPNNPPTLDIIRYAQDKMVVNSDTHSHMLDRQKFRDKRLRAQIRHQLELYLALYREVHELKNDVNLNDDAKQKEQRFHEHFKATKGRVLHELPRLTANLPDCDLNRVTEEIADMERALEIFTAEYPLLAAMLEELKTALLSSQKKDGEEIMDRDIEEISASASQSHIKMVRK